MTRLENWNGVSLPGDYTLEEWLDGDGSAAFFKASRPDGYRTVVKLVPESEVESTSQLDFWNRVRQLRHPTLIELLDCGKAEHGGETALYAIFEAADDTLASALAQAPLNQAESREVLDSVLKGLRCLHAQGLVLGALGPDSIVAVGDRVKLTTDAVRDVRMSSDFAHDVRLLGEFWQQALMAAHPHSAEIAAHATDPDWQKRWSLEEISASLNERRPPIPVEEPQEPLVPPPDLHSPAAEVSSRLPKWPFAAAAAVALLIVGLNWPRRAEVATTQPQVQIPAPASEPSVPVALPKAAAPKPSPADSQEMWRVIAFTYRTQAAAAKKVEQLNRFHPGLDAKVFSPNERKGYYLVALGGRMNHDDAVRLQRSARGKGLPRDLYVQNYTR